MLVKKDLTNMNESIYECDRCHVQMKKEEKVAIYTSIGRKQPVKQWDLCKSCFRSLVRGINKNK